VGGGRCRRVHLDAEVLLLGYLHLLGELVVVDLGRDIGNLAWHLEVAELLLRLDHAHVDILLVCGSNLLLLLLEDFDLLCNGELLHCTEAVSDVPGMHGSRVGLANVLMRGVSSDGLRRCAMCKRRPAGPMGPCWPCCWSMAGGEGGLSCRARM